MLRWSIALFRVFGIRLEVHVTFVLLLVVAGWLGASDDGAAGVVSSVGTVILMFGIVVLHELGHAFAASRYGIRASRILLLPIGGMAEFDSIPREPRREILISLAGPTVNFLLAGLVALLFGWSNSSSSSSSLSRWADVPTTLLAVNLIMGVFNLLPVFPMDGGRVLRALIGLRLDYLAATRRAARIGQTLALLIAFSVSLYELVCGDNGLWLLVVLFIFIAYGAETEYRFVRNRELYAGLIVANVTRADFLAFTPETSVENAFESLRRSVSQDLMLIGATGPVGIVPRARLAAALRTGHELDPLSQHAESEFAVLQAEWPLGPVVASLTSGKQRLFPVYSLDRLIGVLDTGRIEENVRVIRQSRPRW
jgi:Zn-dependent protease